MKRYKVLKPITALRILYTGDENCVEFMTEYVKFLQMALPIGDAFDKEFGWSFPQLHDILQEHPKWEKFLLDNGFIEEEKSAITYHVGQRFRHIELLPWEVCIYVLVGNESSGVGLVSEADWDWWGWPTRKIKDPREITQEEFNQYIANGGTFELVKPEDGAK